MAISTVVNSNDLLVGRNENIAGSVNLSSSQHYDRSESDCSKSDRSQSEDDKIAMRLPKTDQSKALEDAKDLLPDSYLDQQEHQHQQRQPLLNSASSSMSSSDHISTKVIAPPLQQLPYLRKSFEASPSAGSRERRGNQGIKAARQRLLLEKVPKLQVALVHS